MIGFTLNPVYSPNIEINTASQNQTTYELTLSVAKTNTEFIEVSKYIGEDLEIEAVYHKGVLVPVYLADQQQVPSIQVRIQ